MRPHSLILLFVIEYLSVVQPAWAQSETVKTAMQPFIDSGEAAGLVTFIGDKGGVLDVQVLGMVDTTPYPTPDQLKRLAMTYSKENGKLVPRPGGVLNYMSGAKHPVPAGGLFSTGDDLARLYQCLLNKGTIAGHKIIGEQALTDMTSIHTGDLKAGFIDGSAWGYGVGIVKEPQGVAEHLSAGTFGHGGAFGTQSWIDPTKGVYTILLLQRAGLPNSDGSPMRKALHDVAAALWN